METVIQAASELLGRASGPLHLRLVLQPAVAIFLAVRAGLRDAQSSGPVFLWGIVTGSRASRRRLLRSAWQDLTKLLALAVTLDLVYSIIVLHAIRPVQTIVVVLAVSIVPYALVRGPTSRLARHRRREAVRTVV